MALATRPKPNVHHKKRQAQHHRQGKAYFKAYWPYLPMLAIMAGGTAIDRSWNPQGAELGQAAVGGPSALSHATSRLDLLSGNSAAWLGSAVALLAAAAVVFFMVQNGRRLHAVVVRGEHFISSHPVLDIAAVFVFTAGFVLIS